MVEQHAAPQRRKPETAEAMRRPQHPRHHRLHGRRGIGQRDRSRLREHAARADAREGIQVLARKRGIASVVRLIGGLVIGGARGERGVGRGEVGVGRVGGHDKRGIGRVGGRGERGALFFARPDAAPCDGHRCFLGQAVRAHELG